MSYDYKLENFPISFFSVVMGLLGLTLGFQKLEELYPEIFFSNILLIFSVPIFVLFLLVYLVKILFKFSKVEEEFFHPIKANFFPTISISFILFSIVLLDIDESISFVLWFFGSIFHFILTLVIISFWIQNTKFELSHINPSWFIPAVGNILIPIAGVELFYKEVSWFFFSIGIIFWIILLTMFFYRIVFHHPMPDKLLPTLFILIAPPTIGFISFTKLTGHELGDISRILYYFGLFLFILLLFQIKLFAKINFYLSWWAYSFPLAALTVATYYFYELTSYLIIEVLFITLLSILSLLILILVILTIKSAYMGNICVEE